MSKKNLAQVIRDNPGGVAIVDNDSWTLYREDPANNPHDESGDFDAADEWSMANELASDNDVERVGDGYGSGNIYGGDILQALAAIVGTTVESV
jgi:hypothetical protein